MPDPTFTGGTENAIDSAFPPTNNTTNPEIAGGGAGADPMAGVDLNEQPGTMDQPADINNMGLAQPELKKKRLKIPKEIVEYWAKQFGVDEKEMSKAIRKTLKKRSEEDQDCEIEYLGRPVGYTMDMNTAKPADTTEGHVEKRDEAQPSGGNVINNPQDLGKQVGLTASKQGEGYMKRIVYANLEKCTFSDLKKGDFFRFCNENETVYQVVKAADEQTPTVADSFGGEFNYDKEEIAGEQVDKLQPIDVDTPETDYAIFDPIVFNKDNKMQGFIIYKDDEMPNTYVVTWDPYNSEDMQADTVNADEISKLDIVADEELLKKLTGIREQYIEELKKQESGADEASKKEEESDLAIAAAELDVMSDYIENNTDSSDIELCIAEEIAEQEEMDLDGTIESYVPELLAQIPNIGSDGVAVTAAKKVLKNRFKKNLDKKNDAKKKEKDSK